MEIKIFTDKIELAEIKRLAEDSYGDMVKAVVDIENEIVAVGGEWHADAEKVLLDNGSNQKDLWGINLYSEKVGDDFIEYNSLINIRPKSGNRTGDIELTEVKDKIKKIINNSVRHA